MPLVSVNDKRLCVTTAGVFALDDTSYPIVAMSAAIFVQRTNPFLVNLFRIKLSANRLEK